MKKYKSIKEFVGSNLFLAIVSFVGLYFLTTGIAWIGFSYSSKNQTVTPVTSDQVDNVRSRINLDAPKTESCPINGQLYTKDERGIWEGRSPILAVIENHVDSRPPSGISLADAVYEAVAEGGITRFLNVFYCGVSSQDWRIGPIRSARVYFINWASEYGKNPVFLHVGGANNICKTCPGGVKAAGQVAREVNAFDLLEKSGWRGALGNALDGGTNVGYPTVWRDYERISDAATEHTFMGSTDKLFDEATRRGFGNKNAKGVSWDKDFVTWQFIDDKSSPSSDGKTISFEFWSNKPEYDVMWKYVASENKYLRFNGSKEHLDMETKEQLFAKNVVIMFTQEKGPVDNEGHMFYQNIGSGKAIIFQNGEVKEATWSKADRVARTIFKDSKGKEVPLVRGKIWIEAVPTGNQIQY